MDIPEELKIKEKRLKKITEAKKALEAREDQINPEQPTDDKKH